MTGDTSGSHLLAPLRSVCLFNLMVRVGGVRRKEEEKEKNFLKNSRRSSSSSDRPRAGENERRHQLTGDDCDASLPASTNGKPYNKGNSSSYHNHRQQQTREKGRIERSSPRSKQRSRTNILRKTLIVRIHRNRTSNKTKRQPWEHQVSRRRNQAYRQRL